eukprot:TRINITY_DN18986_c0_g1_i1.p1 TRINITY_DN18986_c0_g1~~TRINITY_DN18986_c0_g1_i1.p1  ORF type:complete len:598 (+),score=164.71 TRINITY_DN18986_c0_g1_i1:75-1868(+)
MAASAEATFHSGPLQLVHIDDNGTCHVQEDAAAILGKVSGRLAVVGIAGLYRTGKSFLLNRLLGLQEGFEIGPTVNPCTKGLWIWGQPVELSKDYYCILIDTEGLGSTQRTASCDMQILSLTVLLSSYFIYNGMGAIDEQAVEDLHLVLHLAKHIHVKSRRSGTVLEAASELSQYFPSFLWTLRDFHLRLVDDRGNNINEKQYLEEALKSRSGQEDKNKVRDVIKDLFRDRDACTIVRPVADERDLRNIERLPYEALRPEFRTQVEAFVKRVYTSLKPKKIGSAFVTGATFVSLVKEYCNAINNSAVPTIHSAWSSVVQHQLRLCLKDAVQLYRSRMNDYALMHLPLNEAELRKLHKEIKAEAVQVFAAAKFDTSDAKYQEFRGELSKRLRQLYEHVQAENANASRTQCERIARELYDWHVQSKLDITGSYRSFDQLMSDWERMRTMYLEKTAGPAQHEVLSECLMPRLAESFQRVWQEKEIQLEMQQKQVHLDVAKQRARESCDSSFESLKMEWKVEKAELERQLSEAKRSVERLSRDKAKLEDDFTVLVASEMQMRTQLQRIQQQQQFNPPGREEKLQMAKDKESSSSSRWRSCT